METNKDFSSDEFPFAKKKNQRTLEELAEFTRRKKMKEKKEEEKKEHRKKKKLFEIFKNLSNLKESYSNINNNMSLNINSITGINKNSKRKNKPKKKHKEVNTYYVGTESSKSTSTVLDLNEYYLNILESQQLVVNSKLNKINNNFFQGEENNKNNYEINDNNIKINNYINDNLINEKVNDTIRRANKLLNQNNSRNESQDDFISILENKEIKPPNPKRNTKTQSRKLISRILITNHPI